MEYYEAFQTLMGEIKELNEKLDKVLYPDQDKKEIVEEKLAETIPEEEFKPRRWLWRYYDLYKYLVDFEFIDHYGCAKIGGYDVQFHLGKNSFTVIKVTAEGRRLLKTVQFDDVKHTVHIEYLTMINHHTYDKPINDIIIEDDLYQICIDLAERRYNRKLIDAHNETAKEKKEFTWKELHELIKKTGLHLGKYQIDDFNLFISNDANTLKLQDEHGFTNMKIDFNGFVCDVYHEKGPSGIIDHPDRILDRTYVIDEAAINDLCIALNKKFG